MIQTSAVKWTLQQNNQSIQSCSDMPVSVAISSAEQFAEVKVEVKNHLQEDIRVESMQLDLNIYAVDPNTGDQSIAVN